MKPFRHRSFSTSTITDKIKRKREEFVEVSEAFAKSRKTGRSPPKLYHENEQLSEIDMEELKDLIKQTTKEIKNDIHKNREEIVKNNEAVEQLKNEFLKQKEEWLKEKDVLEKRIQKLERKMEEQEKSKKRNNIVIKGLKIDPQENVSQAVVDFLKRELKQTSKIKEAYKIGKTEGKQAIVAEVESWEQKMEIMKNKNILKGKNYYIDNYLTVDERKIQNTIKIKAKEEKEMGRQVKVMYRGLIIDGKSYVWDDSKQRLEPSSQQGDQKRPKN